jgi:competence protein ComEA
VELSKREKIGLAVLLTIIVFLISFIYFNRSRDNQIQVFKNSGSTSTRNESTQKEIKVYICGEIRVPNVYTLVEGDRLIRLVEMAGGLTSNADSQLINMAMKLKDEDYIRIPSKNVIQASPQFKQGAESTQGKININTAGKEELKTLPRIGDAYAQRIIEYREKNGYFKDIKDIMNVSGIGEKMYENIKNQITVY